VERGSREVSLGGHWVEAEVVRGEPPAGFEINGPAVLELPETTLVLPEAWAAVVDEHGTIVAERA
jgi:N-methylhydantoinase A